MIHSECLSHLKTIESNSIDALVTDPPAGISFMGKDWDSDKGGMYAWEDWLHGIAKECLRVMKPGAHGLIWALPRTSHWTAMAFDTANFEIRDSITHIFSTGFPKGIHLKPAHEIWWLIRKPFSEPTIAANINRWGCGGLNIEDCRIGTDIISTHGGGDKLARMKTGKSDGVGEYRTHVGRYPANLVLSEEFEDIPTKYFYVAKASKEDKGEGNTHPTPKSTVLMEYLIKLITPQGGTVLDPFMGSGSTGVAAKRLGFKFIGIEQEKEYFDIAKKRIG